MAAKKQVLTFDYAPPPPCAYEGCGYSSYVKIKTTTGWANVCTRHYEEHFKREAMKTCERLGLNTPAQMRQWIRDNPLKIKRAPVIHKDEEFGREVEEMPF